MTDRPVQYSQAAPVAGAPLSRPIAGLGRLLPGTHAVDVLSVTRTAAGRWAVILQASSKECHCETVDAWPLEWRQGVSLKVDIIHTPGYILYHSSRGFQARDAQTLEPKSTWLATASDVYSAMLPVQPASTQLGAAADGHRTWHPVPSVHPAADTGADSTPGDAAPG